MKRRDFFRQAAIVGAGSSMLAGCRTTRSLPTPAPKHLLLPQKLRRRDTVALITPGSYIEDDGLQQAYTHIESLGLVVKPGRHLRAVRGFTAGTDQERLSDLHQAFRDPQVRGVWCARGGYGCARLLPMIDYQLVKANPKVLIGYSDITALHLGLAQKAGLVTFHGPVGASDFTDYTREQLQAVLFEPRAGYVIRPSTTPRKVEAVVDHPFIIRSGTATGPLLGGNLSLVASLVGTPYMPDLSGALVFLEDVGERPYRVDRMLTQLRQGAALGQAAGVVLGVFEDSEAKAGSRSLSLQQVIMDRIGDLQRPAAYGLSFGHRPEMTTFPVGVSARFDTSDQSITLLHDWMR